MPLQLQINVTIFEKSRHLWQTVQHVVAKPTVSFCENHDPCTPNVVVLILFGNNSTLCSQKVLFSVTVIQKSKNEVAYTKTKLSKICSNAGFS